MDDTANLRAAARRALFLVLLLLLLGATSVSTKAAVRFDMFVGYDGLVPQGGWLPVTFEVQNDDDTFFGTVEVTPGQMSSGQERTMRVELPQGTTKRFTIPVFSSVSWNPTWSARLYDERRRLRAQAEGTNLRRLNAGFLPVAAALSRHIASLPETKARQPNMRPAIGRFQPALVPDSPLAFDGLDTFYLASERALDLKPAQVSALVSWLHGGGHLIVSVEQPGHLTGPGAWLTRLLPGVVAGLESAAGQSALERWVASAERIDGRTYDFARLARRNTDAGVNPFAALKPDPDFASAGPLQVARFQVRAGDGSILIGTPQQPLVITARRGLGRLTVFTFAPELEPFRGWKNAPYFWAKAVDLAPDLLMVEWPNRTPSRPIEAVMGAMIDSRQIRKLPVGWLLLLLIAYLLVIGPVDQWWLKKINRQMLTWVTFPLYVVFFSLLIYFIGYKLRAGETEWSELHVVDIIPTADSAGGAEIRGRTYGSIYSPVNARYAFVNEVPNATFRGEYTGSYGGQDVAQGRIEQRADGVAGTMSVPVWTSQLFISDWWRRAPAPISLEVTAGEIRIANSLDRPLVAAQVVIGGDIFNLGQLPAHSSKTFVRTQLPTSRLDALMHNHGSHFTSVASARQQVFSATEGGRINDWTNGVMAASFARQLDPDPNGYQETFSSPRGFDLSDVVSAEQAVLVAWAPGYAQIPALNRFPANRAKRDTVFRVLSAPR